MKRSKVRIGEVSLSAIEDAWQRRATEAAIEAVCRLFKTDGAEPPIIPPATPLGRLGNVELGWIVAAALFGWISTRAEQAVAENINSELCLRITGATIEPWDAGAVASILPELAEISDLDWTKPLSAWSREQMVEFLATAMQLILKAEVARDLSERAITGRSTAAVIARETCATAGGSLTIPGDPDDDLSNIPF
jgi:hypothetical protein